MDSVGRVGDATGAADAGQPCFCGNDRYEVVLDGSRDRTSSQDIEFTIQRCLA